MVDDRQVHLYFLLLVVDLASCLSRQKKFLGPPQTPKNKTS